MTFNPTPLARNAKIEETVQITNINFALLQSEIKSLQSQLKNLGKSKSGNATHTGEVTGAVALVVDKVAITNKTTVTADGTDFVLLSDTSDSGALKKALVSDFGGGGGGGSGALWDGGGRVTGTAIFDGGSRV